MFIRVLAAALISGLFVAGAVSSATAQQPAGQAPQSANQPAWQFNIAPYIWLPSVNATLGYNLPPALGGRLPTNVSSGPGDYLPHLNFAAMFAADARYDRFSVLTDFMYVNGTASQTNITSLNFFGLPARPISRSLQVGVTSTLKTTIWTLAGGYTVLRGDWGNLDLIAGFRFVNVNANTDYSLALTVTGPRGNGATFGGVGGVSGDSDIWNGIAGLRGSVRLANTNLFIPYYADIGAGGSNLTWQVATGLGYQTRWAAISALYRYLTFEQSSSAIVRRLSLGGPLIMVSFRF